MSEWNGRDIYLAFRYTAKRDRNRKDIQSLHSILIIQLKRMLFLIRYGQMLLLQNVVQLRINCRKIRPVLFSPLISGHLEHRLLVQACLTVRRILESWVITSPVDPSQVIPDYGTLIKSYSEVVPGFYDYTYYKPGKFTVTVVSRNATAFGTEESVQNIEIEIVEKLIF